MKPSDRGLDGTSFKPHLLDQADFPDRKIFFGYEPKLGTAMRNKQWKLQTKGDVVAIVRPGQGHQKNTDVADQYPERSQTMQAAIARGRLDVARK